MTMQIGHVNFLAILVSAAAYWIIGALWYSPVLFAKPWTKHIGKTREQMMEGFSKLSFLWSFVWSFVAAYGIARILVWANGATVVDGFLVGLLAGVCFIVAPLTVNNLFDRRPLALLVINAAYHSVALMIAGIIIGAWR
jgi:hypothetical protein